MIILRILLRNITDTRVPERRRCTQYNIITCGRHQNFTGPIIIIVIVLNFLLRAAAWCVRALSPAIILNTCLNYKRYLYNFYSMFSGTGKLVKYSRRGTRLSPYRRRRRGDDGSGFPYIIIIIIISNITTIPPIRRGGGGATNRKFKQIPRQRSRRRRSYIGIRFGYLAAFCLFFFLSLSLPRKSHKSLNRERI